MCVVKEPLDGLRFKLFLKTSLFLDNLLCQKLLSCEGRHEIDVHSEHTERALMGQTDW